MVQIVLAVLALGTLFYFYGIKPMRYWKERGIKQTKPVWFLGDKWGTIIRQHNMVDFIQHVYNSVEGERYYGMYQFTVPTLVIKDIDLIKQICVKDFEYFIDRRPFVTSKYDTLMSKNLFALKGQQWRDTRPVLSPVFTGSKMKAMFTLMLECAQNFTNYFLKQTKDSKEVELKDIFGRFATDVIATTAFGITIDSLENRDNEFYVRGKETVQFGFIRNLKFFGFLLAPKLCEIFKITFMGKEINNFFTKMIDDTVKVRTEKGIVRPDLINVLLEARKSINQKAEKTSQTGFKDDYKADLDQKGVKEITNEDIVAHAMVFFFAGSEAVSNLMCFMAYELAISTDIQNRLRKEIKDTDEECKGVVTYEVLVKMKYMDMVVSETLRKYPFTVMFDRICTKSYTIRPINENEKPFHIEKGTTIMFPIWGIHRDPKYYADPERFDPERFSDENKGDMNPYAYLPFGAGPRNCIGLRYALLETKILFYQFLSNFEITPGTKTKIPLKLSSKLFNVAPEGGSWLLIKRIKQ